MIIVTSSKNGGQPMTDNAKTIELLEDIENFILSLAKIDNLKIEWIEVLKLDIWIIREIRRLSQNTPAS